MPDWNQSTSPATREAQTEIADLLHDLRQFDQHLAALAATIDPSDLPAGQDFLTRKVYGTIEAVRSDLLDDAIKTLDTLTTMTEAEARADALANDKWRGLRLVEVVQ